MFHLDSLTKFAEPHKTTIAKIVEIITGDGKVQAICEKVRKSKDRDERRKLKLGLPAFVLGEFSEKIVNKDFVQTEYLLFDIDHLSEEAIPALRTKIDKIAYLSFISPSGEGIKFAIKMKAPVTKDAYASNYDHYMAYFRDYLDVEIDPTKDPSRKCYYSHDPGAHLNPKVEPYPSLKADTVLKVNNVDVATVENDEIADICRYLKETRLSYHEWTICAMSLQDVDNGFNHFLTLSTNNYYKDSEDNIRIQFQSCKAVQSVTLGSLYWIAMNHGYKRKEKFLKARGTKYPFTVEKNGSYYRDKKDNYTWVFGWKTVEYLYDIREVRTKDGRLDEDVSVYDGGNELMAVLKIDGDECVLPASAITSGSALRSVITKWKSYHIAHGRADQYFNMLSEYLHKTKTGAMVKLARGIGRVLPNIWNWGNYAIVNGNVYDFEPIVWGTNHSGIMMEKWSGVSVNPKGAVKTKLNKMLTFYGKDVVVPLGWNVANLYYPAIRQIYGGFPILFLHGATGKGKTKLGNLLLAMWGVEHPESDKHFKNVLADMTNIAGSRLKNNIFCFPTFYDEYNQKHYHLLKSLYDGSGRTTALKDQTNRVKNSEIFGGTITASLNRPHEKEVLNRCVYFDVSRAVNDKNADAFNDEYFIDQGFREMSALMINLALHDYEDEFMQIVRETQPKLLRKCRQTSEAIGRITMNYAIAYAGYQILVRRKLIEDWTNLGDWVGYCNDTVDAVREGDPTEAFMVIAKKFAANPVFANFIRTEESVSEAGKPVTMLTVFVSEVLHDVQQYCDRMNIFPDLLGMNAQDVKQNLRKSPCFVEAKTMRYYYNPNNPNSGRGTAYIMAVPDDDPDEQSDLLEDIPF